METLGDGLFSTKPVKAFPFEGEVIELQGKVSVNEAFQILATKNLLSAPVWDEVSNSYLGFFDVTDVVRFATDLGAVLSSQKVTEFDTPIRELFKEKGVNTSEQCTGKEDSESRLNAPWHPVNPETPMSEVLKVLATDARRVPVVDPDSGKVKMVISQSLVTRELSKVMNVRSGNTASSSRMLKKASSGGSATAGHGAVAFANEVKVKSIKEEDQEGDAGEAGEEGDSGKAGEEGEGENEEVSVVVSEDEVKSSGKGAPTSPKSAAGAAAGAAAGTAAGTGTGAGAGAGTGAEASPGSRGEPPGSPAKSVLSTSSDDGGAEASTRLLSKSSSGNSFHVNSPGPNVPAKFLETPRSSGIGLKEVATISEEKPAIEAFRMLAQARLSAVGVVDEDGMLLSCISAKDIRLLPQVEVSVTSPLQSKGKSGANATKQSESYTAQELLSLPAIEFVSKARLNADRKGKARPAVVVVSQDTPFYQMVAKLAKTGMHRLFITDTGRQPVGVISVSDIVKLLAES